MQDHPAKHGRTLSATLRTVRGYTAGAGLVAALASVTGLCFAGFGVHEAMFDLDYAVGVVALRWSWALALGAAVLGVAALVMTMLFAPRRGFVTPLTTLVLAAGALAALGLLKARVATNPPVHEVATDWADPLLFGPSLIAARGTDANPVPADPRVGINHVATRYEGMRVAELNARACPGAVPVILVGAPEQAYAKARQALVAQGYELVSENPAAGRIEATATTKWLKLQGDVVVRIRPEGAGARADFRASTRTGEIDMGESCRRVVRLRRALNG